MNEERVRRESRSYENLCMSTHSSPIFILKNISVNIFIPSATVSGKRYKSEISQHLSSLPSTSTPHTHNIPLQSTSALPVTSPSGKLSVIVLNLSTGAASNPAKPSITGLLVGASG